MFKIIKIEYYDKFKCWNAECPDNWIVKLQKKFLTGLFPRMASAHLLQVKDCVPYMERMEKIYYLTHVNHIQDLFQSMEICILKPLVYHVLLTRFWE